MESKKRAKAAALVRWTKPKDKTYLYHIFRASKTAVSFRVLALHHTLLFARGVSVCRRSLIGNLQATPRSSAAL